MNIINPDKLYSCSKKYYILTTFILCAFYTSFAMADPGPLCLLGNNNSPQQLADCITTDNLIANLIPFQAIADANGGNRDSGSPGYNASVNYVAGVMRSYGYHVTIQNVTVPSGLVPHEFSPTVINSSGIPFQPGSYATIPIYSSDGTNTLINVKANFQGTLQPVGQFLLPAPSITLPLIPTIQIGNQTASYTEAYLSDVSSPTSGCTPADFSNFKKGNIALMEGGSCSLTQKIQNAATAGASAALIFNDGANVPKADISTYTGGSVLPFKMGTTDVSVTSANASNPSIPAIFLTYRKGVSLYHESLKHQIKISGSVDIGPNPQQTSYNVIADLPGGDPNNILVVDAHLDSIYGAGIDDNATGSAAILDIAEMMSHTHPLNHIRFIWFGAEESGLIGSAYYLQSLSSSDLANIKYDIDVDTIGTQNNMYMIESPQTALVATLPELGGFPVFAAFGWNPTAAAESTFGSNLFISYFTQHHIPYVTDGNFSDNLNSNGVIAFSDGGSFLISGIPSNGIYAGEFYGKTPYEVSLFGGTTGAYESCGDIIDKHCDNLTNVSPSVFTTISQAYAYVISQMSNTNPLN